MTHVFVLSIYDVVIFCESFTTLYPFITSLIHNVFLFSFSAQKLPFFTSFSHHRFLNFTPGLLSPTYVAFRTYYARQFVIFSIFIIISLLFLIPCGRLSWLSVSLVDCMLNTCNRNRNRNSYHVTEWQNFTNCWRSVTMSCLIKLWTIHIIHFTRCFRQNPRQRNVINLDNVLMIAAITLWIPLFDCNFITRLLYTDIYWSIQTLYTVL